MKPLVVKLGGSLAETGRLKKILALVCRAEQPVVIVPGGGPFADAVRSAQRTLGFDDAAAHIMALHAMEQMGLAMLALERRLVAAETLVAMRRALEKRRIPVWLPVRLCEGDRIIPRDWTITSDALAARLAERLGGAPVMLVKSCTVARTATAEALSRAGVVDRAFPGIVRRGALTWHIVGPGEESLIESRLGVCPKTSRGHPSARRRPRRLPPKRQTLSRAH